MYSNELKVGVKRKEKRQSFDLSYWGMALSLLR